MSDAAQKVEQTRARLRTAMSPPPPPERRTLPNGKRPIFDRVKRIPFLGVVVDAVESWWVHHPLRPMSHVVGQASTTAIKPLAQSNPLSLVAGAAVAGAVLVWSRPWRWLIRPALFAGLVPQIASRIVARIPVESWMVGMDSPPAERNT